MDQARVVEVWAPGVKRVGSGYLLTDRLVLTSYHLVQGLAHGARVEVRPLEVPQRIGWLGAALSWPHEVVDVGAFPERDAALLVIDGPGAAGSCTGAVRFGQVTGQDRTPCLGLGFPDAEMRPDKQRDTMSVRGHVDALQARKSGLLTVHVDEGIVPRRLDGDSGWAGASGTAVFCGDLLVGVLATDRALAEDASVLRAVPMTALAALSGFRDALAGHGLHLVLELAAVGERQLATYTRAALLAAARHPYAGVVDGELPPLAEVYLVQQARQRAAAATSGPGTLADDDRVGAPGSPVAADDVLANPPTCVILAGPGGGKSSLLRTRLADGVKDWQDGRAGNLLPVLVSAAVLAHLALPQALAAAVNADLALLSEFPAEFFAAAPRPGVRWLVLVDGLDEVPDRALRRKILNKLALATSGDHAHLYRFVITTRPLPDGELDALGTGVPRYDLQPFEAGDLERVAQGWFRAKLLPEPAAAARRFVQTLKDSRLAELARTPLMIAMLCQLHADAPTHSLPASRGHLYRDFVNLLGKKHTPGSSNLEVGYPGLGCYTAAADAPAYAVLENLQDLIGCLAAQRLAGNTDPTLTIVQSLNVARCPESVLAADWRTFLDTVLRNTGLLNPQAGDLVFLHQTFVEYLASRHLIRMERKLTGDPHSEVDLLDDVRPRPARYWPWGDWVHGVPRVWGRRYWQPPRVDPSYVGFILDAASYGGPDTSTRYLSQLAQSGLPGSQYIISLHRLGTRIPDDVLRTTADFLHALAHDTTPNRDYRMQAARELARLGDPCAADIFHALAQDTTANSGNRMQAARELAGLGDPRGASVLRSLAQDTALTSRHRMWAARGLAGIGDLRAASVFRVQAQDTTLDSSDRVAAARWLARLGDLRAAHTFHTQAQDTTLDSSNRMQAARELAGLGDPRATNTLHTLARDTTLDSGYRVEAARRLARIGDPRAADILHTQAHDTTLDSCYRVEAARGLARLGDLRAAHTFHDLAQDTTADSGYRVGAARGLAGIGDLRAADILHTQAHDTTLDSCYRVEAARGLARLGDPRAADILHTQAHDTTLDSRDRMQAARELAGLGDLRAANTLHTLTQDTTADSGYHVGTARGVAGLGDARAANTQPSRIDRFLKTFRRGRQTPS